MTYLEIFLLLMVVCQMFVVGALWALSKYVDEMITSLWLISKKLKELEKD